MSAWRRMGRDGSAPMNANLARIIAIELLAAAEGIDFRRPLTSSEPLEATYALIRAKAKPRETDREFTTDIEAVAHMVESGAFESFVPDLLSDLGVA